MYKTRTSPTSHESSPSARSYKNILVPLNAKYEKATQTVHVIIYSNETNGIFGDTEWKPKLRFIHTGCIAVCVALHCGAVRTTPRGVASGANER